jgi:hypothetical protein
MKSQYRIAAAVAAMTLAAGAMAAQDSSLIRITRQNQLAHDARQAKLAGSAQAAKPQAPAKPQADSQPAHVAAAKDRATAAH